MCCTLQDAVESTKARASELGDAAQQKAEDVKAAAKVRGQEQSSLQYPCPPSWQLINPGSQKTRQVMLMRQAQRALGALGMTPYCSAGMVLIHPIDAQNCTCGLVLLTSSLEAASCCDGWPCVHACDQGGCPLCICAQPWCPAQSLDHNS